LKFENNSDIYTHFAIFFISELPPKFFPLSLHLPIFFPPSTTKHDLPPPFSTHDPPPPFSTHDPPPPFSNAVRLLLCNQFFGPQNHYKRPLSFSISGQNPTTVQSPSPAPVPGVFHLRQNDRRRGPPVPATHFWPRFSPFSALVPISPIFAFFQLFSDLLFLKRSTMFILFVYSTCSL